MKRVTPLLLAAVVVMACTDDQPPATAPLISSPLLTEAEGISDGGHGGNQFFYWLPELVESPVITETFNPEVPASIRICELGDETGTLYTEQSPPGASPAFCVAGTDVELFGTAGITVTDTELSQQYSAVWKTDDPIAAPLSQLDPDKFYRLSVWVGEGEYGQELGFRYLDPEASPPAGSGAKLERLYPFKLGNTINIKFWIGAGAFCLSGDPNNCGECFYTESGADDGNSDVVGRACTVPDETAGVFVNSGIPEIDGVLLVVEYIPTDDMDGVTVGDGRTLNCYADPNNGGRVDFINGLDIPQYGQCFVVTPICTRADGCPDYFNNTELNLQAIIGSCPVIPDDPELHPVLHRTDDANNPTFVQALKPASTEIPQDFLNCDPSFASLTPLQKLAWAWNKVSPFGAAPAYADHRSLKGAEAPSFSDFVWAVPAQEEKAAGDNQVGLKGTMLPEPLTVQVTDRVPSANWDGGRNSESIAVAGAEVTLALAQGEDWGTGGLSGLPGADGLCGTADDAAISGPLLSDQSGQVSVCVTLPGVPGKYHVEASGYGIGVAAPDGTGPYSHGYTASVAPITLPKPPVSIAFEVTACQPGFGSIGDGGIDGVLGDGEWDCAAQPPVEFTANTGGGKKASFFFEMTDDDYLYMAVQIPVDETASLKQNTLTVYLNDKDADFLASGHDVLVVDGTQPVGSQFKDQYWTEGKCPKGQSFCAFDDPIPAGSGAFQLNYGENGAPAFYFYEVKIPVVGDCDYDICLDGSNTVRAFFTIRGLGSGNKGNTEYPGPFGEYAQDPLLP
jgi:hypothetical protein